MPEDSNSLSPATREEVADGLAFALHIQGRKRAHNAEELASAIVAWSSIWSGPASSS
jgi:hypothetical protein